MRDENLVKGDVGVDAKLEKLREALIEGEVGKSTPFDLEAFIVSKRRERSMKPAPRNCSDVNNKVGLANVVMPVASISFIRHPREGGDPLCRYRIAGRMDPRLRGDDEQ